MFTIFGLLVEIFIINLWILDIFLFFVFRFDNNRDLFNFNNWLWVQKYNSFRFWLIFLTLINLIHYRLLRLFIMLLINLLIIRNINILFNFDYFQIWTLLIIKHNNIRIIILCGFDFIFLFINFFTLLLFTTDIISQLF